ncbi:MAG: amidohydrolase [Firmicutes bacterium]|nr:amidohydrolase [Bacillota bacterium]
MKAIKGGRVLTITQGTLDGGVVLIEDGKIKAVGREIPIPPGAEVIDATGCWVTPGFIDAHSHIGLFGEPHVWAHEDGNEMTNPITPHMRAIDAINPADPSFADVVAAGVTTVFTGPGSGNVIGGLGVAIKLVGRTVEEMVIPGTEALKMALGENPKRVYGEGKKQAPSTRMGNAAVLREALVSAQNYMRKHEQAAAKEDGQPPERDLRWEVIGRALRREIRARIHCHRADDMMTAIRIAEEFNLVFSLEHATEGYKIADILAQKGVPCVVGPLLMSRSKMELNEVSMKNAGILARAGVKVAIQVDSASSTRWLPVQAGLAVRYGMPEEDAFRAITINAAEIIGVADRLGSLEPGKDADIAIFNGHPFCTFTQVEKVIIDGRLVYERPADLVSGHSGPCTC